MSSAIGDILLNPKIEGSLANEKMKAEERSMLAKALSGAKILARAANSGWKSAASLPDAIHNTLDKANPLNLLQEALTGTPRRENKDPIEKALRAIRVINDLPKAETTAEKYAESIGDVAGGLVVPGGAAIKGTGTIGKALGRALLGTNAPVTSLKQLANRQFASTAGGAFAQAGLNPSIEEQFPNSPTARLAASLGTGILGGAAAGGLAGGIGKIGNFFSPKTARPLPQATAAQMGDIADPRIQELTARQLDLTKTDPKAANILNQIAKNQEEAILSKLQPETSISGKDIINTIGESIDNLKTQRSQEYENALASIIENAPNSQINIEKTLNSINQFQNKSARGSKIQGALEEAKRLISNNMDDPERLIDAKKAIQDMTQYRGEFSLGDKQSATLKKIAKQLNEDIGNSLPGYGDLNKNYSSQTKNIETLLEGVAGKAGKFEADRPSQIVRQLFEKTDPELVDQIRQLLPAEIYDQAANLYLADVANKSIVKYTPLEENNLQKFQQIAKVFEENSDVLMKTLPEKQRGIVQEVIQDIGQTGRGRPRNEFTVNANRGVVVGDEVKGIGKAPSKIAEIAGYSGGAALGGGIGTLVGGPLGAGIGAGIGLGTTALGKKISSSASKRLRLNEMLTGQSPSSQVVRGLGNAGTRLGQKFATADSLSQDEAPIQQQQLPPQSYNKNPSYGEMASPSVPSLDDLIQEFKGSSNAPTGSTEQPQAPSLDDLIQEFKGGGNTGGGSALAKGPLRQNRNSISTQKYYNMGAGA